MFDFVMQILVCMCKRIPRVLAHVLVPETPTANFVVAHQDAPI